MSSAPDSSPCSIHETVQSKFAVNDLAVLQDYLLILGGKSTLNIGEFLSVSSC